MSLRVVEIGRHGDHGIRDLLPEIVLRGLLQLFEHQRRNFRRGVVLATRLHADVAVLPFADSERHHGDLVLDLVISSPHEPLDGINGVLGVGDGLSPCYLPHETLSILIEGDDARRNPISLRIHDDLRFATFDDRNHRVGRAEVDSNRLTHVSPLLSFKIFKRSHLLKFAEPRYGPSIQGRQRLVNKNEYILII